MTESSAPPPPQPPQPGPGNTRIVIGIMTFVAVALAAVVAVLLAQSGGDDTAETYSPPEPEGSDGYFVLYEPPGDEGPDAFMSFADRAEATGTSILPQPPDVGGEAGLYGGSLENTCNPELLIWFLERNPEKATAWAAAQGIAVADIPAFIQSLRPAILGVDTRVTNHGFSNGMATPRQTVLAAGSAVMISMTGTPEIRCYCGNPLDEPEDPPPSTTTCPCNSTTTSSSTVPETSTTSSTVPDTSTTSSTEPITTTSSSKPPPSTTTTTRVPDTTTTTLRPPPTTTTTTGGFTTPSLEIGPEVPVPITVNY